jgi:septal ring factor EnvC (AmiA/AmiB activator)
MSETGMTRNVTMLRVFSLAMGLLALVGWGTFVYAARTSAAAQQQLQEQVAELKVSQSQLMAERDQARAGVADLKASRDQLTTERDEAKAQLIAAQQEVAALTKRLEEAQVKASETGSTRPLTPAGQPARSPAQTNRRR